MEIISCDNSACQHWKDDYVCLTDKSVHCPLYEGQEMLDGRCSDFTSSKVMIKPCPFCGCKTVSYDTNQGTKWGFAVCGQCSACGPEVRTGYDISENAEWHIQANIEWNNRCCAK